MRCIICNNRLSNSELKQRDKNTGKFLDTCLQCMRHIYDTLSEFEPDERDIEKPIDKVEF